MKNAFRDLPFGYALHRIVKDADGNAVDYRFLEVNPAFEGLTGLRAKSIIGKTIGELLPGLENSKFGWASFYKKINELGKSEIFEQYFKPLNRWYQVQAFSRGEEDFATIISDITDHKKKTEELESFFSINLDLLCIADTKGNFLKVNKEWETILGYSVEELEKRNFLDFIHPEDIQNTLETMKSLEAQENIINFVNRYRGKDGSYRFIEWRSHPKESIIYAAARDITDKKLAELTLRNSEARFRALFEDSPMAVLIHDAQTGEILDANARALKIYGFTTLDEMKEKDFHLPPPYSLQDLMRWIKKAMDEGPQEFEWHSRTKEGLLFWEQLRLSKSYIDDRWQIISTSIDITERKMSEALIKSYAGMQGILITMSSQFINIPIDKIDDAINDALLGMGTFVDADRAFIFSYDWKAESCGNTYEWCRDGIAPQIGYLQDIPIQMMPDWIEVHRKGKTIYINDIRTLPENSGIRLLLEYQDVKSLIAIPMMDRGSCVGFTGFDSIRKQYTYSEKEKTLLDIFAEMLINVTNRREMERNLIESKELADRASKVKSEFLANMSHEIRTPMNAIMGLSKLALDSKLPMEQQDLIKKIYSSSQFLLGIINDVLDYSKIEAGKMSLDLQPFNMKDIFDQLRTFFDATLADKGLDFILNIPPELPSSLLGDSLRLGQVLTNLIGNAIKFTDQGQVELRIRQTGTDRGYINLLFEVIDTGIGIGQGDLKRLFEAFTQGDTSTTRKYGGTGLGLVISSRLVSAMGGKLLVESELGTGSRFFFELRLPIQERIQSSLSNESPRETVADVLESKDIPSVDHSSIPVFSGYSILLVEDNELNMEVAYRMLVKTGARIDTAFDGKDAVKKAKTNNFDLILMDIQMPVMDGYEATKLIRAFKPRLPILALSAAVMQEELQRIEAAGMAGHLAKPINDRALYALLSQWLRDRDRTEIHTREDTTIRDSERHEKTTGFPLTLEGFDLTKGLNQADGDEEFYLRMLRYFHKALMDDYVSMIQLISDGDLVRAKAMAHTLKGLAGTVGAMDIQYLATTIDGCIKKGEKITGEMLSAFEKTIEQACVSLSSLPPPDSADPATKNAEDALELLLVLNKNRVVDQDLLKRVRVFFDSVLGEGSSDELVEYIEAFDYSKASRKLRAMARKAGIEII